MQHKRDIYILFTVILLPIVLVLFANLFVSVIPKDTPVLIIPQENVSDDDLTFFEGIVEIFANPTTKRIHLERAERMLLREEYYAVISVPPGVRDVVSGRRNGTIRVYFDNGMMPVARISDHVINLIKQRVGGGAPSRDILEAVYIGDEVTLPLYLLPGLMLLSIVVLMVILLPNELMEERDMMERLAVNRVMSHAIVGKIMFFDVCILIQFLIISAASAYFGMNIHVNACVLLTASITGLYLGSLCAIITLLARRSQAIVNLFNLLISIFSVTFSSAIYPIGFLNEHIQNFARMFPTYHSAVMLRAFMIKGVSISLFTFEMLYIAVFASSLLIILLLICRHLSASTNH